MRRSRQISPAVSAVILALAFLLVLLAGWHREMAARYPVSDLPFVDRKRLEGQIEKGNVGRSEALFYRKDYAGADTAEIR